jgi:CRISPR-associated endonuclease/helicase Cas3
LPELEASAVALAAQWHDLGKRRDLWQRSIGNRDFPGVVLAKSGRNNLLAGLNGYRHEFGSMVEASRDPEFLRLDPDTQDLVLHLIGAHHGRARPHFPADESFDPACTDGISGELAREVPRRFGRLQRRYGRWGLAYLESLVRAADISASQNIEAARAPEATA